MASTEQRPTGEPRDLAARVDRLEIHLEQVHNKVYGINGQSTVDKDHVERLQADNDSLRRQVEALTNDRDAAKNDRQALRAQVSSLAKDRSRISSERDAFRQDVIALQSQIEAFKANTTTRTALELMDENATLRTDLAEANASVTHLRNESKRLQSELERAEQGLTEASAVQAVHEHHMHSLKKALKEANNDNERLSNEVEGLKSQRNQAWDLLDHIQQQARHNKEGRRE